MSIELMASLLSRQSELHQNSEGTSEYSTGLAEHFETQRNEMDHQTDNCSFNNNTEVNGPHKDMQLPSITTHQGNNQCSQIIGFVSSFHPFMLQGRESIYTKQLVLLAEEVLPPIKMPKENDESSCNVSNSQFASPLPTTPPFRSLADEITTPEFTASVSNDFDVLLCA